MLYLEGSEDLEGVTLYPDDIDPRTYYLLPQFPRIRLDQESGKWIFKLVRYRTKIDRPGGMKAGGLVAIDCELAVPADREEKIRALLEERVRQRMRMERNQPVQIKLARPTFSKGTAKMEILTGSDVMVQSVNFAAKPSLVGNNVISGSAELTEMGVATLEAVMKGTGSGMVRVEYDLWFWVKLPPLTVDGRWSASKFYSFLQEVDYEERFWSEDSYTENVSEYLHNSEAYSFVVTAGPGIDQKTLQSVQDSMRQSMDEMVKRNILEAIPAADRDVSKIRDQDIEDIRRTFTTHKSADVTLNYRQHMAIEYNAAPNVNLPSLASLGTSGAPIRLEDYFVEVDGDHPFFRTLALVVQVNADFENLPIFSVDVSIDYPPATQKNGVRTLSFRKPDDVGKFEAFMDGGGGRYKYKYTVNYKGESRIFEKPWIETDVKTLTINVDDLGVWMVDIETGDINFEQVDSAQLTVRYEDPGAVPLIERQFTLSRDLRKHEIRELIFAPRSRPYQYRVKYFMKGGRELEAAWQDGQSQQLYVNDPFSAMRSIAIRAKGDFETRIDSIFLDLVYEDAAHSYRLTKSQVLSKAGKLFEDWVFPAFDERAGTLTYQGQILYRDGASAPIPATVATSNTILVGEDVLKLEVEIVPDLIDWSEAKLVIVELAYEDTANGISQSKSFTLKQGGVAPGKWIVNIKDKAKKEYRVQGKYFMQDGSKKEPPEFTTDDGALVLQVPA
jgi:hypothetical protein